MRHKNVPAVVVGLFVIVAAAWIAAAAAPTARADSGGKEAVKTFTIPASATAVLRWTFKTPPTTAVKAYFQISRDKTDWTTLKVVKVAKGTKKVRTTWKAGSRPRCVTSASTRPTDLSNLVNPGEVGGNAARPPLRARRAWAALVAAALWRRRRSAHAGALYPRARCNARLKVALALVWVRATTFQTPPTDCCSMIGTPLRTGLNVPLTPTTPAADGVSAWAVSRARTETVNGSDEAA